MGIVEEFSSKRIAGWAEWSEQEDDRDIRIMLNGVEVARTVACRMVPFNGQSKPFGFTRNLTELFSYVGPNDEITIEHQGKTLPIVGYGSKFIPQMEGQFPSSSLLERIDNGFIFTSYGALSEPLNKRAGYQKKFMAELTKLHRAVLDELGIELFVSYGTLLGCIRENDFIAHDQDFDLTYISHETSPEAVKAENVRLRNLLIDLGCNGVVYNHFLGVQSPVRFDLCHSWFDEEGKWQISFGYHGTQAQRSDDFFKFEERQLGEFTVRVPLAAEEILAQMYGDGWRIPDPGFCHNAQQTKPDPRYLLDDDQVRAVYWHKFYTHYQLSGNSPFAEFVLGKVPAPDLILDIGCGTGRDTVYFARMGHSAVGVDACQTAIERAAAHKDASCRFELADMGHAGELDRLLSTLPPVDHPLVYLRFFLHAVPEEIEDLMLTALVGRLSRFTLAAEFRTDEDKARPKHHRRTYRRYITPDRLQAKLEQRYGMVVRHREEGLALSVYQDEDPHLCRMIAVRQ